MAREKVGGDVMQVRFPDGTFVEIDRRVGRGKRSEFIRDAVAAMLGGREGGKNAVVVTEAVSEKPRVIAKPAAPVRRRTPGLPRSSSEQARADAELVFGMLRERARTERALLADLGWAEGRMRRVIAALGSRVRYREGMMVVE